MTDETVPDTGADDKSTPSPGATPTSAVGELMKEKATIQADKEAAFVVPDTYKDKPWVSKIKTQDDLWKQLDNTQALVGKKSVVPDFEKGDAKEIEAYVAQLRPKDASAYKLAETIPEADRTVIAGILHETGLPAALANPLMDKLMAHVTGAATKMFDKDGFMGVLKESFGDGFEKTAGATAKVIAGLVNEKDRELLERVPNEYLGLIYRITAGMHKAYGASETSAAAEGGEGGAGTSDKTELRKQLRTQLNEMSKRPHTDEERMALSNKLADTYKGATA